MSRFDFLCPGLIFLIARSCQSEFGCAADEKLFTVAADFNRLRDPCDPFLLCASNPLGGRALWLAASVASTYGGQRRDSTSESASPRIDGEDFRLCATLSIVIQLVERWRDRQ